MDDKCYVLLIDILGFTELVNTKGADEILDIITKFLGSFEWIEKMVKVNISSIYFSDSVILWQRNPAKEDFLKFTTASVLSFSHLLAYQIPCRGTITYGPFIVKPDISNKYDIFFGRALIEAYKAQSKEKWIGVTVCPSAVEHAGASIINKYAGGHFLIRNDKTLLLNPFLSIQRAYKKVTKKIVNQGLDWVRGTPLERFLLPELLAFKFILETALTFSDRCDFSSKVASKYHSTVSFLQKVLPRGCFKWAQKMCNCVEMKFGKPLIIDPKKIID